MPRAKRTPDVPADRLDEMLVRLKLAGIRDQLDSLLDEAARSNLSTRETLAMLCEREIARKDHRRIDMALKLAHFPAVKELASFDFEAQPPTRCTASCRRTGPGTERGNAPAILRRANLAPMHDPG
jgi:DNA replication protein DnaC